MGRVAALVPCVEAWRFISALVLGLALLPLRLVAVGLQLTVHQVLAAAAGRECGSTVDLVACSGLPVWLLCWCHALHRAGAAARHRGFQHPGALLRRRRPSPSRAVRRARAAAKCMEGMTGALPAGGLALPPMRAVLLEA